MEKQVKGAGSLEHDLTPEQVSEYIKCANDVFYFVENYVMVQHPKRGRVKFELYDYQRRVFEGLVSHKKNIMLQPRQTGKTISIVAYILHKCIFTPDILVGVAAHKGSGAKEIIARFKYAYENLPYWIKPAVTSYNVHDIAFDNGTKIMSQATTENTYRGLSLSLLYLDEMAFISPRIADTFWTSILPSLSAGGEDSEIIITSTPNGTENIFASIWHKAEMGDNDFNNIRVRNEEVPGREDGTFKQQMLMNMSDEKYRQEFECEFISSEGTLIHSPTLEGMVSGAIIENYLGMDLYEDPKGKRIGVSVDVGNGVGQDYSTIQVFDLDTLNQVAEYRNNRMPITDFTNQVIKLLTFLYDRGAQELYYTVEANSIGSGVLSLLENSESPVLSWADRVDQYGAKNMGILITNKSKLKGCALLKDLIEDKKMTIRSKNTISELKVFTKQGQTFKAEAGMNDDLVMALVGMCLMLDELSYEDDAIYAVMNRVGNIEMADAPPEDQPMGFTF